MAGILYLVSTPIGNLEDMSARGRRVLGDAAVVACEDTRVTRKLLDAYAIKTPTVSFHAHSDDAVVARLIERLTAGESVALVSDAGTPLVSDPGEALVAAAIAAGIKVEPIPGASAVLAALIASGLPAQPFLFLGFLPKDASRRREILSPLRAAPYTLVIYEATPRLSDTLLELEKCLDRRSAAVGRELTKHYEEMIRGDLASLAQHYAVAPKGEAVIVVGPAGSAPAGEGEPAADPRAEAQRLLDAGEKPAEVAKVIAGAFGLSKKEAYQLVLDLKR